jgi:hypothetical protein
MTPPTSGVPGWLRAALATLCLVAHLGAIVFFARDRFELPWNRAPGSPPAFTPPGAHVPAQWNRLPVSRWDSVHYVNLALRGYADCPPETRRTGALPPQGTMICDVAWYPGYPLLGRLFSLGGRIPIDYALLAASLISAWVFFFLWTAREVAGALGTRATLVSLLCFNLFTTAFAMVTIQTEPPLLAATLGAFVLARRGRLFLAATVAGAATGLRVSGVAAGLAFAALIAVEAWQDPPRRVAGWIRALGLVALGFWGLGLMLAYDGIVLHDPLIYVHAHEAAFGHRPSLMALLWPSPAWIVKSFASPLHEGAFVAAALLWFAIGHRQALRGMPPSGRAYWYVITAGVLAVSALGSVSRGFIGMNRYVLAAVPVFFAMGKVLEKNRLALAVWLGLSAWHYWNVDLCFFIGDAGVQTMRRCHALACADP